MPALDLHNEHELLMLVAKGDQKAFRQLFDHYRDHIYSVAFVFTKSSVLSEEIVQDVFLKIWLKGDQLTSVEKFDAYLFTVARNHIYNQLRKKSFEQPFVKHLEHYFLENSALPEQKLLVNETKGLIDKAVAQLPEQQRTVYELSRNYGLDHGEIAGKLGISRLTVKSHMTKALKSIRQSFQAYTGEVLYLFFIIFSLLL